jgi:hypothetical protein
MTTCMFGQIEMEEAFIEYEKKERRKRYKECDEIYRKEKEEELKKDVIIKQFQKAQEIDVPEFKKGLPYIRVIKVWLYKGNLNVKYYIAPDEHYKLVMSVKGDDYVINKKELHTRIFKHYKELELHGALH